MIVGVWRGARLLAPCLVVFACCALAAEPAAKPDPNSPASKSLPRSEFLRDMDAEFVRMDTDRNKDLTRQEVQAFRSAELVAQFRQRNHAIFAALDKDKNGVLSAQEFAALVPASAPFDARPFVAGMDLNHDGKVSLVEHRTATLANFDRLDTDKDGVVSAPEMRAGGIAGKQP